MNLESEKPPIKKNIEENGGGMFRRICSWCNKDMGTTGQGEYKGITHGMCEQCAKTMNEELDNMEKNDQ